MNLLTCILAFILVVATNGYPQGAPKTACGKLEPNHLPKPTEFLDVYSLSAPRTYFLPGKEFEIELSLKPGADEKYAQFKGIILTMKSKDKEQEDIKAQPYGSFGIADDDENYQILNWKNGQACVTHTNNSPKDFTSFTWTAPADACDVGKEYYFAATVVYTHQEYQMGLRFSVACQGACLASAPKMIKPLKADFDMESNAFVPNSWQNIYVKDEPCTFKFVTVNEGDTYLANTGTHYISHAPGMLPRRFVAVLRAPYAMQGCFCFKLYCRMFSKAEGGSVKLTVMANAGQVLMSTMVEGENWVESQWSIVASVEKVVPMIISVVDRGEVHIDDISFAPGLCSEDSQIYYIN